MPSQTAQLVDLLRSSAAAVRGQRPVALVTMLRLNWFTRLRWVFLAAATAVLILEHFFWPEVHRPQQLTWLLVVLGSVNIVWVTVSLTLFRQVCERPESVAARHRQLIVFANAQVAVDLMLLTCILRYTGGAENPLAIFYLFHMAIVSLLLQRWQAVLQGVWTMLLYTALVVGEWQQWFTPHCTFLPVQTHGNYAQPEYVLVVLGSVAFGIFGVLYLTLNIAARLDARERELWRANTALQLSQRAIEDLQHRRSRFMQTAAHQLKNPLAVIQTLASLIRTHVVKPGAIRDICERVMRRCIEGTAQVTELLTLARIQEADPNRHRRSEADVRQIVSEVCSQYEPLAKEKGVTFQCRMPTSGKLTTRVDARDLKDCVSNLIDNAVKYTAASGQVRVTVTPIMPDGDAEVLTINIADTGIGLDPGLLVSADGEPGNAPVFDAFRRGNNAAEAGIPGTGLGLSIVQEVVEQVGGRIRVLSRPGRGTTFAITLPAGHGAVGQPEVRDTRAAEIVVEPAGD